MILYEEGSITVSKYSVWVGGIEVNDYLLTESEAKAVAREYQADAYDEVQVEGVK